METPIGRRQLGDWLASLPPFAGYRVPDEYLYGLISLGLLGSLKSGVARGEMAYGLQDGEEEGVGMRLARRSPTPAAAREPATGGDRWRDTARDGRVSAARGRKWRSQQPMERP
jgi:hypothetical protein